MDNLLQRQSLRSKSSSEADTYEARIFVGGIADQVSAADLKVIRKSAVAAYGKVFRKSGLGHLQTLAVVPNVLPAIPMTMPSPLLIRDALPASMLVLSAPPVIPTMTLSSRRTPARFS